jgi:hypothetical protein
MRPFRQTMGTGVEKESGPALAGIGIERHLAGAGMSAKCCETGEVPDCAGTKRPPAAPSYGLSRSVCSFVPGRRNVERRNALPS